MSLNFDSSRAWFDRSRQAVAFTADAGKAVVVCHVSVEALENHFGLRGDPVQNALPAFERGRDTIHRAASAKHSAGEVILVTSDFGSRGVGQMVAEDEE
jgi:hypothetical protein